MDDRNFINAWDIKSKREEYFKETFDFDINVDNILINQQIIVKIYLLIIHLFMFLLR